MEGGRRRLATGVVVLLVAVALVGPVVATGLVLADADRGHGNECDGTDAGNPGASDGVAETGSAIRPEGGAHDRAGALVDPRCDTADTDGTTEERPSVTTTATPTPTETPTPTPTGHSTRGAGGGQSSSTEASTPTPAGTDTQTSEGQRHPATATPPRTTPQPTAPPSVLPGAAPGHDQPGLGEEAPPLPMVEAVPGLASPADAQPTMGDVAAYSVASAAIVGLATGLGWLFVRP